MTGGQILGEVEVFCWEVVAVPFCLALVALPFVVVVREQVPGPLVVVH